LTGCCKREERRESEPLVLSEGHEVTEVEGPLASERSNGVPRYARDEEYFSPFASRFLHYTSDFTLLSNTIPTTKNTSTVATPARNDPKARLASP
jgi:hypothetical protein